MSINLLPTPTGRQSLLRGRFIRRGGKTVLTDRYHEAPLKISKTFELSGDGELLVYMMDASPGILDGDRYLIDMHLEPETKVYLTNQSHTKVHPTPRESSSLIQHFIVENGAVLEYFPEPLIPYAGSDFTAETRFDLRGNAVLLYGDIVTAGRLHHGEQFLYDKLDSRMEAHRDGRLVAWDRFCLMPKSDRYRELGAMENYSHSGSLWIMASGADETLLQEVRNAFPAKGLLIGGSLTAHGGMLVRMLGSQVWLLQETIHKLAGICRRTLLGKQPHLIRR
ncbi:urease accessory protein UreD [Paenibacillus gansuensis]|uniref:Urease accessory protein UreD n=1 Tax=Paenibacillus gansuensis TaxID=306542 RepID=A0ABW5P7D6_9BACL